MYFELQLSTAVFTHIVRNRLKALPLCIDKEFVDTDGKLTDVKGARVVVDQVTIGGSTSIQREKRLVQSGPGIPQPQDHASQTVWIFSPTNHTSFTVPFLQVRQDLTIHLVKATDLEANGPLPTPAFKTFTINLVINVALHAANQTQGGGPLVMSYSLAYIDYGLLALLLPAQQQTEIEQAVAALQLPSTTLDLGPLTGILKRPVAAINAGIVCAPDESFVALRVDFDVYKSPIAVERSFFLDPPQKFIGDHGWAMLVDKDLLIADVREKVDASLKSAPKVKVNGGPNVGWDVGGAALVADAEVELVDACPFFVDDIDMDADVDIRVAFSAPQSNVMRTHFNLTGEPSDVGEEILCALTGALLWPFLGPIFLKNESLGEGIGVYLAGLAAGPVINFIGIIAAIETKSMSQNISSSLGATCKKIDDENYECNDPLALVMQLTPGYNSQLNVDAVFGLPRGLVIGGSVSNLREYNLGNLQQVTVCPFEWQVSGRCTGNGRSNYRIANLASISLAVVPPAGMCSARILHDPEGEFAMTLGDNKITIEPRFKPGYVANPYPCRIRLITNRGVRTLTLAAPTAIGNAEQERLETGRLSAHMGCYYWERMHTPVERIQWLVDPPFAVERVVQFWQIAVRGIQSQEEIRVETPAGATVMSASPSQAGVVHMTMVFDGEEAPDALSLELQGRREEGGEREMTVQQALFAHVASLPVSAAPQLMRFEGGARNRRLLFVEEGREIAWDVRNPTAPALLHAVAAENGERDEEQIRLHNGKGIGYARSENLHRALAILSDRLGRPEATGSPKVGGVAEALYLRTQEGAALYDISAGDEPRLMHTYNGPAWLENTTMGGRLLGRYDAAVGVIDLYVAVLKGGCG